MSFVLKLIGLCSLMSIGLPVTILFLVQYGPLVVFGFFAGILGITAWKNEARKTGHREYDDKLSKETRDKAFEDHVNRMKQIDAEG
jgi:hypothetical protein